MERKSLCEYFYNPSGLEGHRCGYCKSQDTNISQGMWTHFLSVDDYQDLIDRGWRRSGKYCYKPAMSKTCCPMYTISCSATNFRPSKSQKGVLKKIGKYLVEGVGQKKAGGEEAVQNSDATASTSTAAVVRRPVQPGKGADPSKLPCRKSKVLRKEKREKKELMRASAPCKEEGGREGAREVQGKKSQATSSAEAATVSDFVKDSNGRKPLEAFLSLPPPSKPGVPNAHNLEIKLVRSSPPSDEFKATFAEVYAVFKKYQMSIHKEPESKCEESGYRRFLCDSPLIPRKGKGGWPCDYGSYHQHYRVDGKLIAVGIVDILPKCLSSVYLFYDPDYDFLDLGVYSALREVEFVRRLHPGDPEKFKYYYMGYYIHSCQKMRYKGNYNPSFLLCPESYCFVRIEDCLPKLETNKYSRFSGEEPEEPAPEDVERGVSQALVLIQRTYMTYGEFRNFVPMELRQEAMMKQYVELVGPQVAARMMLVLGQGD